MSDQAFKEPPKFYRGTELWMLNDRLEDHELRRQIKEMSDKGFYTFIARTYVGLKSDYPGPAFMERMAAIISAAKEYDMKVFLQAGYMPGAVLDLPEAYALSSIQTYRAGDIDQAGEILCSHNNIIYRAISSKTTLDMMNSEAMRFYMVQSYEDMWQQFEAEFGKTILSVWVDEPYYSQHYLPWSSVLAKRFREKWHYDIADKVYLLYVDEAGSETVRYHYWQTVLTLLKESYFTEVRDWCHRHNLLFSGHLMAEDSLEAQISQTCTTMPFYKYFDMPGIDFLTVEMNWLNNSIPAKSDINDRRYGLVNTPLQCSSAAHQAGQHDILCEMFGVSTQNLLFRDQKHLFDHFASMGINHKCSHAIFYSLRGRAKRAYPPHINYYQPYWEQYGLVNDYMARASWFISQGKPIRQVLVLHPINSAFCEYHGPSIDPVLNTALERRDQNFYALLRNLLACQCDFELGDEDTISEWGQITEDGQFKIGEMAYRVLILPDLKVLQSTTLTLLEQFSKKGGRIYVLGQVPDHIDGQLDIQASEKILSLDGVIAVPEQATLIKRLATEEKDYRFVCYEDATQIQLNHRCDDDQHYFFFFNKDCRDSRTGNLSMTGNLTALRWDGKSGTRQMIPVLYDPEQDRTSIDIYIEAGGSLMMTLSSVIQTDLVRSDQPTLALVHSIKGPWTVERKNPNVLLLEYCRYRKSEQDSWSEEYPILAVQEKLTDEQYTGPIYLQFSFRTAVYLEQLKLALESPEDCTIKLDGQPVDSAVDGYYLAREFACVPLPMSIRPGQHEIEISRSFIPLSKAKSSLTSLFEDLPGVELEALYLIGEFAVNSITEPTHTNSIRLSNSFILAEESNLCHSELVSSGYPFYAGTIVLQKTVHLNENQIGKSGIYLELAGFRACSARVRVNGQDAGIVAWAPYQLDVSGLVSPGDNAISIELTNTLRNLLGPYHRPKGEFGECFFRGYGNYNIPWFGSFDYTNGKKIQNWAENRKPDTLGWTEAYMQVSFGIRSINILIDQHLNG